MVVTAKQRPTFTELGFGQNFAYLGISVYVIRCGTESVISTSEI